jgi:hypothetical protein
MPGAPRVLSEQWGCFRRVVHAGRLPSAERDASPKEKLAPLLS